MAATTQAEAVDAVATTLVQKLADIFMLECRRHPRVELGRRRWRGLASGGRVAQLAGHARRRRDLHLRDHAERLVVGAGGEGRGEEQLRRCGHSGLGWIFMYYLLSGSRFGV